MRKTVFGVFMLLLLRIWALLVCCCVWPAKALIGPDGKCALVLFAPFTTSEGEPVVGILGDDRITVGFSNMAAGLLAVQHFNERNIAAVPQLKEITKDCNITLHIDKVFDTSSNSHLGSRRFLNYLFENNRTLRDVCAIAGADDEEPAIDLSRWAFSAQIPFVVSRSWSLGVVDDAKSPYTTSMHPDTFGSAAKAVSYLKHRKRDNFIAILHPFSDIGLQRRSALGIVMDSKGMRWMSSEYFQSAETRSARKNDAQLDTRTIRAAVKRIRLSGYRTIIIAAEDAEKSFPKIAAALDEFGMLNGEHFFLFHDEFDPGILANSSDENVDKLVNGASYVFPTTRSFLPENGIIDKVDFGPVGNAWEDVDQQFIDTVNSMNPIPPGEKARIYAGKNYFRNVSADYGADFMYDAVMSIGCGACMAAKESDGSVSGWNHREGIRAARYEGASGSVDFGKELLESSAGARPADDLVWFAINFIPVHPHYQVSDFMWFADNSNWQNRVPYMYAPGNTTVAPQYLRDEPDQNYLTRSSRITAFTLMGFSMLSAVVVSVWVFVCRKEKTLAASQPPFLLLICFGTIVQSSAVLPLSFDEETGQSTETLSSICMAYPWLLSMGCIIVGAAIFGKLWRVHQVLQFRHRSVSITSSLWPMVALLSIAFVILTLWTAIEPMQWKRTEVDEESGESYGDCHTSGEYTTVFVVLLLLVLLGVAGLVAFIAFKTRDIDSAYSDSQWIFITLFTQVEILLVATPILIRMSGEEKNTSYITWVAMTLSFPLSTLGLLFVPKVFAYCNSVRGADMKAKRGQRPTSTKVSGLVEGGSSLGKPSPNEVNNISALPMESVAEEPTCSEHLRPD